MAPSPVAADPLASGILYLAANRVDTFVFLPATHVEGGVFRTTDAGATASLPSAFRYGEWAECSEKGPTLCLENGRCAARAIRAGAAGHAVARVLDGRSVNGHYWIALSTFTDDPLTLTVTDSVTGRSREYHGAPGQPLAVVDRETFASD